MKTTDKSLQRKTINLTPEEVEKALIYYLEKANHNYEKENSDGEVEYIGMKEGQKGQPILMGKDTSVEFALDGSGGAKITTYYGD